MKRILWGLLAVGVVGGLAVLASTTTGVQVEATDPPATATSTTTADTEQDVIDACHRSIIARSADHPILGTSQLHWESDSTTHPAPGRYDVTGTVVARDSGAEWRFAYMCKMAAEQASDGEGRWVAIDNGFTQQ